MLQMVNRKRRHYTDSEKSEMWDRWRNRESLNEIGRAFAIQGHSSIQNIFSKSGGEAVIDTGNSIWILRRQPDGSWKIARGIYNSDIPIPGDK
jgi:hypothetical protein